MIDGYDFSQNVYELTPGSTINEDLTQNEDIAHAYLGDGYHLPSEEDFQELLDNCTSSWVNINGVNGIRLTSNLNGLSIFLPAAGDFNGTSLGNDNIAGFYWTKEYSSNAEAKGFNFSSTNGGHLDTYSRSYGFTIRAVK